MPPQNGRVFQPHPGPDQPWSISYHSLDWVSGARRRVARTGFATEEEAEAALAKALADIEAGIETARPPQRTVAAFLEGEWLPAQASDGAEPSTLEQYRSVVEQSILPHVGEVELTRLTAKAIQGLYDTLAASGATPDDLQVTASVLRSAFDHAVRENLLPRNPAAQVEPGAANPAPEG